MSRARAPRLARLLPLALLALPGSGGAPGAQEPPPNGESFALFQGLARCRRIDLHIPSGACERAAARLAAALEERKGPVLSSDPAARDPEALRILVGAPEDPALAELARALGAEPLEPGFRLLGREYLAPGDALVAVLEDPERDGRPLCLVLGNDLEAVAVYLDGIPRLSRPHLWVHADGELALECPLALDGTPRAEQAVDYLARRRDYFPDELAHDFGGMTVHTHGELDPERWRAYGATLARVQKKVLGWFGAEEPPPTEVFLYEHAEDFERCLGESVLSLPNRLHPRVHALVAPGLPDDGGSALARALARALAGEAERTWIEDGLAVSAAASWWGRPLDEWAGELTRARLLPQAEEVVSDLAPASFSEHQLLPARGVLFQQAVLGKGTSPNRVRALWKSTENEPKKIAALYTKGLEAALKAVSGGGRGRRGGAKRVAREAAGQVPLRRGLALLEDERAGYASRATEAALDEALALDPGPDSVSLTVLACATDPRPPLLAPRLRSSHPATSDVALASACAAAHARELSVLLSLEVLSSPSGAWADVLSWTGPDDSLAFFARYERVALHEALLAELLGVEIFSFGSNLRESTRTEVQEERRDPERLVQRREGWTRLIQRLRGAYTGPLTYAARFPSEAQEIAFFEQLDFIGLLFYPSLTRTGEAPDEGELRRSLRYQLQQALDFAVRWNRPLLLSQLGFPSRADSWARSFVPRGALDLGAQERFFSALADVLETKLDNVETLRGYYLWNWPLDERASGPEDGGFSLRGKPVEAALRRLFAR